MSFAYRVSELEVILAGRGNGGRVRFAQRENRETVLTLREHDIECGESFRGCSDLQFEFTTLADRRGRPFHDDFRSSAAAGDEPGDDESESEGEQK